MGIAKAINNPDLPNNKKHPNKYCNATKLRNLAHFTKYNRHQLT